MWQPLPLTEIILGWDSYGSMILVLGPGVSDWGALSAATLMLVSSGALPLSLMAETLFTEIAVCTMTVLLLFILARDVLVRIGPSSRFLDVVEALTCRVKGGFGSATVLVCEMCAPFLGPDAAVGRMTIDRLGQSGYPRPYACARAAEKPRTGIPIPRSISCFVFSLVSGIAASTLFLAALIPGILILVTNTVLTRLTMREGGGLVTPSEWRANLWMTAKSGWYPIMVPGIIFYGIFSGRMTPAEAGAVGIVVTMAMGFYFGPRRLSHFSAMMVRSTKVNGVILRMIGSSILLAEAFATVGVSQGFVGTLTALTTSESMLIVMMELIPIAAGWVMETTSNIVHLAPILMPLADNVGMNEILVCIMMITALGVGVLAPLLGFNLYRVAGYWRVHSKNRLSRRRLRRLHLVRGLAYGLRAGNFNAAAP